MGKYSGLFRGLAVAGLICLGSLQVAKADMLTPGPSYTALVTYDGTNSTSGYFSTSATETVTFTNIGGSGGVGITVGTLPTTNIGNGDACYNGCSGGALATTSPIYIYLPSTSAGLVISGTNAAPTVLGGASGTYDQLYDQFCILESNKTTNSCNTNVPGSSNSVVVSYTDPGGVFQITSNSLGANFTLTVTPVTTPEPSVLLTLGSGLIGLLGFGIRRKVIL
jgi:hypothetical protein